MSENISRPYTFVKDGAFYFSRRIPKSNCPEFVVTCVWPKRPGGRAQAHRD